MPTLLLTRSPDAGGLTARPCRIHARLLARVRVWRLDLALAGGDSPDASAMLSLRARRLICPATRRALAREIRDVICRARCPRNPFDRGVRICADEVLRISAALEELADRLDDRRPVESAGVARVRLLLRDGAGSLYNEALAEALERSVIDARDALEPRF